MATNTAGSVARYKANSQQVHYLRKSIVFGDNGTTVTVGTIPAGSVILTPLSGVQVNVAFNGNATNTLDLGASDDSGNNNIATLLALGTIGFITIDETTTTKLFSVDTRIDAVVVSTASATTGAGEIIICYVPDNDG
jgi:hypothetical protein